MIVLQVTPLIKVANALNVNYMLLTVQHPMYHRGELSARRDTGRVIHIILLAENNGFIYSRAFVDFHRDFA